MCRTARLFIYRNAINPEDGGSDLRRAAVLPRPREPEIFPTVAYLQSLGYAALRQSKDAYFFIVTSNRRQEERRI